MRTYKRNTINSHYVMFLCFQFKKLRAIIVLSCGFEDEIPSFMKMMSLDLVQALKDLR